METLMENQTKLSTTPELQSTTNETLENPIVHNQGTNQNKQQIEPRLVDTPIGELIKGKFGEYTPEFTAVLQNKANNRI